MSGPQRVFIVAGEHSGDALGEKLIAALRSAAPDIVLAGVGGAGMIGQGLSSLFPLEDVAVMGPLSIMKRLPLLVRRVKETAAAAVAFAPDCVVIIDSPEFTHPIARRIRKRLPRVPIIDYVSPSVWAWRPGRAAKMRAYVDHVLALLPFEPEAHHRLGGPACTYVGHPLIERLPWIEGLDPAPLAASLGIAPGAPVLAVLPGSRRSEAGRLLAPFGEAIGHLAARLPRLAVVMPVVAHVRPLIEEAARSWAVAPHLVVGEEEKWQTFRLAQAALAASGTVTLELALARTPAVVAYKVDRLAAPFLRRMIKGRSVVLANLVADENIYPEFLQEPCTGAALAGALEPLLRGGLARDAQRAALARIPKRMAPPAASPSAAAAEIVLRHAGAGRSG